MLSTTLGSSGRFFRLVQEHPDLAEFAHTLYQLLVPHADDFGRLLVDPLTVKLRYYPASARSLDDFARVLDILCLDVSTESPAPSPDQHQTIRSLLLRYPGTAGIIGQIVNFEPHQSGLHRRTRSHFPPPPGWDVDDAGDSGNFRESPGGSDSSGKFPLKGREGKRTEEKGREENSTGAMTRRQQAEQLVALYHAICGTPPAPPVTTPSLPKVAALTEKRIAHACARLREHPLEFVGAEVACEPSWREIFERVRRSPFLCGLVPPAPGRSKAFVADFDWLTCNADHAVQILEGKYDERRSGPRHLPPTTPGDARSQSRARHAAIAGPRPVIK